MKSLTKKPGAVHLKTKDHLDLLFSLDKKTAEASENILPLASKHQLFEFLNKRNAKNFIWVNKQKQIVGYLSYLDKPDQQARAELLNLIIIPEFWRQGYGTKMVSYYHQLMKNKGFKTSKLVTSPKNEKAIRFYTKIGYKKEKIIQDYYQDQTRLLLLYNL
jgi:ribosomal protein S18 acetylase RimI-like enzyme